MPFKTFWMYVSHKWHGQFWGTQFLILVLNSFRHVKFLCLSGKIIHKVDLTLHKKWSFPLKIWSHSLKKYLMENVIFCAVLKRKSCQFHNALLLESSLWKILCITVSVSPIFTLNISVTSMCKFLVYIYS